MMFSLIITYNHKSMMPPCIPFDIVFGRFAILSHDVLFDHHVDSKVHDYTMLAI